jgi:hypothetical protein
MHKATYTVAICFGDIEQLRLKIHSREAMTIYLVEATNKGIQTLRKTTKV